MIYAYAIIHQFTLKFSKLKSCISVSSSYVKLFLSIFPQLKYRYTLN